MVTLVWNFYCQRQHVQTVMDIMYQKNFDPYNQNQTKIPTPPDSDYIDRSGLMLYSHPSVMSTKMSSTDSVIASSFGRNGSKNSSVLRTNFMIVLFPILLWGFPVHLLFRKKKITTTREWLKHLCPCTSPLTSIVSVVVAIISVALNIITVFCVGRLLYILLVTDLTLVELVELTVDVVKLIPTIIPLNLLWIQGYKLRNILASFDRVIQTWKPVDGPPNFSKLPKRRVSIVLMYFMVICIHVLHFVSKFYSHVKSTPVSQTTGQSNTEGQSQTTLASTNTTFEEIWDTALDYSIAILFTLILPIYCGFCWAVKYELEMTNAYIQHLIDTRVIPKYSHLDEIKKISRKISDDIMAINSIFSILLSVILLVLTFYISGEVGDLTATVMKSVMDMYSKAVISPETLSMSPELVRLIVGDAVIVLLYFGLFGFTYWQAVKVNDDVRFMHIWLNDFVTEPDSRISGDLNIGFTLLKGYIHSRLEQERPALLNITLLSIVPVPALSRRLLQYRVLH